MITNFIKENEKSIDNRQELMINFKRKLHFKNIYFKYPKSNQYVLNDLNISIDRYSKIGIVGLSGSGKTTFVDLFMGLLRPTSGNIICDDSNIDLEKYKPIIRNVGYVPQSPYISNVTIKDNIIFGHDNDKFDNEKLINTLKIAGLYNFIEKLDQGYNTPLGNLGSGLSGGQKQRVGIARILYQNPDLIILDESTNSLNKQLEEDILNNIFSLEDKTVIVISHHLNSLKNCDNIFIFDEGKIVTHGSFDTLARNDVSYFRENL